MSYRWTCATLCLGFTGAEETYPFSRRGDRVQGAREDLRDRAPRAASRPRSASSASRTLAEQLRADHAAITPGYHLNKRHWNTVTVDGSLPERLVRDMVEDSYDLVVESLPKRIRDDLGWP